MTRTIRLVEGIPPLGDDKKLSSGLGKRAVCGPVFSCVQSLVLVVNGMEISTLIQKDSSALKAPTVVLRFPYIANPLDTKTPVISTNTPAAPRLHRRGGQGISSRIQVCPLPQIFYSSTKLNVPPTQYAVLQKSATHKPLVEAFGSMASPGARIELAFYEGSFRDHVHTAIFTREYICFHKRMCTARCEIVALPSSSGKLLRGVAPAIDESYALAVPPPSQPSSYIQTGPGSILLYIALMLSRQSSNLQCPGSTSGPSINTRSRVPGLQRVADGEYDMTRQGVSRPQSAMGSC